MFKIRNRKLTRNQRAHPRTKSEPDLQISSGNPYIITSINYLFYFKFLSKRLNHRWTNVRFVINQIKLNQVQLEVLIQIYVVVRDASKQLIVTSK